MPIKNPFRKSAAALEAQESSGRNAAEGGFQQVNVQGAKAVDANEPTEFQLSGMWL